MSPAKSYLQNNIISVLREEALRSFVFDPLSQSYFVPEYIVPSLQRPHRLWSQAMGEISDQVENERREKFPNLRSCRFYPIWLALQKSDPSFIENLDHALAKRGYTDFQFIDHGGYAVAFRVRHTPSGERRILRIEAPHFSRRDRIKNSVILPAYETFADTDLHDLKIEVCQEILPLNKLMLRHEFAASSGMANDYYETIFVLSRGTNLMLPDHLFDRDNDPNNIGLTPSGHIVSFDPEICSGDRARELHRNMSCHLMLRDASSYQLTLIYGLK